MKTLLLKFSGPLQSWGTTAHFETRHTDRYPSKSAVIGLIAASLGYRRDEDEKVQPLNQLDFGVRLDQEGSMLRDYHIAQKYKANGAFDRTYVTNRYYLEDAVYVVAIGHEDDTLIERIENGLKYPYFQPFMGRRSLPLPADFIIGTYEMSVLECLENHPWQAANWYQQQHTNLLSAYVESELAEEGIRRMRQDRVESFSQMNRRFGFRGETEITIRVTTNILEKTTDDMEHDPFDVFGGGS
ncbi:type I-E CRISPR-associated protein Cas5/CasD [Aerococcaceae bacterium WGS1372]